ncbi:MAG: cytochrome c [Rubricoccaceae bacterium]|nr:cytochrome c [Rubricoccaceae bacterium]
MSIGRVILRILGIVVVVVLGATLAAATYVYVVSERVIHRQYDAPLDDLAVPTDSASIAEGERLARIRGCPGCHGAALEGKVQFDNFLGGREVAANLTAVARHYTTAELVRVIRYGVRPNGEGVMDMPSPMYYHLSDSDLGKIIAYLRSLPRAEGNPYEFSPGPRVRWEIARGEWVPWPEDIQLMGPRMVSPALDDTLRYGEYLARTVCSECHGIDLLGWWGNPPLTVAGAYPDTSFFRLMRTGVPIGGRDLELMDDVARSRFSHFTDDEIRSLHAYLRTLTAVGIASEEG